jgi:hypothetical protein
MDRPATSPLSLLRRAVAIASLAGFVAALVGVPVLHPFLGPDGKDVSRPFPCMHSQCGCQTAEMCWRGCCCHTNRQKLAWAKANGVQPPEYVLVAADAEPVADCDGASACCEAREAAADCCAESGQCLAAEKDGVQWGLVPAFAARKCRGLPEFWLLVSMATTIVFSFECQPSEPESGSIAIWSESRRSRSLVPATPPPRA